MTFYLKHILYAILLVGFNAFANSENQWDTFNGDLEATKYSPLKQINLENINNLKEAWSVRTGDVSDGTLIRNGNTVPMSAWSATPIFANDTLYLGTPFYRIFALEPDTGKVKWIFDSEEHLEALTQPEMKSRGVAYWESENIKKDIPCQKIVYLGTMKAKLFAVDADTGKKCEDFANEGVLDINDWYNLPLKYPLSLLQPPTVYKNILVIGWAGKDWAYQEAPLGTIFAIDSQTGKKLWEFFAIPPETKHTGTANVWASMSIDPEKGILYAPISSPSPNFYGGDRLESIPLGTSVAALDIKTGELIWSYQLVHHDLWDYDTNAAPTLIDLKKDNKTIPSLVQTTKQGFMYVLNRYTGKPVYPIEELEVPPSTIPGEKASKTQPFVSVPKPTNDKFPGVWELADIVSLGYCSKKFKTLRYDGRFTPPSFKGSLAFPGTGGGVEWGGGAFDPENQIFVANNSNTVQIQKLIPREEYNKLTKSSGSEADGGFFPQEGAPYGVQLSFFMNPFGMPCWKPPFGELSAYNMSTGKLLWRKPFGAIQYMGFYLPEKWGSITIGAPAITASGLIFIGGSMDSYVRAIDLKNGNVVWKARVDVPAVSNPAIFSYKNKQYVVFTAGGNAILTGTGVSDQVVAFALED